MLAPEASMRFEMPSLRRRWEMLRVMGTNSGWEDMGTMRTFVGATESGRERTWWG
jgi:hypothetical protein